MANSEKFVIVPEVDTTYDGYLDILKEASITGKMVPKGNIVFPFPSSFEEYEILADMKEKIFCYFYEQYLTYKLEIKSLVLFSLEMTDAVRRLYSWEHLESADYTLILSSKSFKGILFGMFKPTANPENATEIVFLLKDKILENNDFLGEIYKLRSGEMNKEIIDDKQYLCLKIPSARILGISW